MPLEEKSKGGQRHRHKDTSDAEGDVKPEAETGVMQLHAKEHQGWPGATRI